MSQMEEFERANFISVRVLKRPSRWMYFRFANASELYFLWLRINWRRSWLPEAAWSRGWNACFRQFLRGELVSPAELYERFTTQSQTRVAEQRDGADLSGTPQACYAEWHDFLGRLAGHKYCFLCGERLVP